MMSNKQEFSYNHNHAYTSRIGKTSSSDVAFRPGPSIQVGFNSRRSSKSQRTTTAASTPHSDDDWPSAPNLFDVEYEDNLHITEEQVNHTLNLQLTQKTIALLAMIRGTTPDRLELLVDDEEDDPSHRSPATDDDNDIDLTGNRGFEPSDWNDDDHGYLVGGDFVELDGYRPASQFDGTFHGELDDDNDADIEEDIFGMEI